MRDQIQIDLKKKKTGRKTLVRSALLLLPVMALFFGSITGSASEKTQTEAAESLQPDPEAGERAVSSQPDPETGETADSSEMVKPEEVTRDWMVPVTADELKDGSYEIDVNSSSSMFRITACTLTVKDGSMSADLSMGGTGYLYVFMGSAGEAAEAEEEDFIPAGELADGTNVFTVPVEALDTAVECAAFSKRKEKWYGRQLCFVAESLPADAFLQERGHAAEDAGLADGSYQAEVTLTGGSGKASIASPAKLEVQDGKVCAVIEWSSPNYDYMIVEGEKYLPVNQDGNSVFEIPVSAFDRPVEVLADTTAMSKPYEIAYTITFDSESIQER